MPRSISPSHELSPNQPAFFPNALLWRAAIIFLGCLQQIWLRLRWRIFWPPAIVFPQILYSFPLHQEFILSCIHTLCGCAPQNLRNYTILSWFRFLHSTKMDFSAVNNLQKSANSKFFKPHRISHPVGIVTGV